MTTLGEEYDDFFREKLLKLGLTLVHRHTRPTEIHQLRYFLWFQLESKLVGELIEEPTIKEDRFKGRLVVNAFHVRSPVWELTRSISERFYPFIPTEIRLHPD